MIVLILAGFQGDQPLCPEGDIHPMQVSRPQRLYRSISVANKLGVLSCLPVGSMFSFPGFLFC